MYPGCCPVIQKESKFQKTLFSIFRSCAGPKAINKCLKQVNVNFKPVPITNDADNIDDAEGMAYWKSKLLQEKTQNTDDTDDKMI